MIVGGGSAGWMTAATLIKLFPEKEIVLIESPNVPTVGVGEATLGAINDWLAVLEIEDRDFMPGADAIYKMSIRFEDFFEKGDEPFHYPFGLPYEDNVYGKDLWYYKKALQKDVPVSDYAKFVQPHVALIENGTFSLNHNGEFPAFNSKYDVAYNFDAIKFANWLRDNYCIPRGVKHIVEEVTDVQGHVDVGIYELNGKYKADLFIDCTGFKGLLINKVLNRKFEPLTDFLPNNKAWACQVPYADKEKEMQPITNCKAMKNGWTWWIPIWSRIGTGYVYSDRFTTDEEALEEFKEFLVSKGKNVDDLEFKHIEMRSGITDKLWHKNVCAIGLSAGFLEPLESTGLMSVHMFLLQLANVLKRKTHITEFDRSTFNKSCKDLFHEFCDFVALHYALSNRNDTPYWEYISKKDWLQSEKFGDMTGAIKARTNYGDSFNRFGGMHYIAAGMNYDGVNNFITDKILGSNVSQIRDAIRLRNTQMKQWDAAAKRHPTLYQYLKDNIHVD